MRAKSLLNFYIQGASGPKPKRYEGHFYDLLILKNLSNLKVAPRYTNQNEFVTRISKLISDKQKSFATFSEIVDKEIDLRIINLKAKIDK